MKKKKRKKNKKARKVVQGNVASIETQKFAVSDSSAKTQATAEPGPQDVPCSVGDDPPPTASGQGDAIAPAAVEYPDGPAHASKEKSQSSVSSATVESDDAARNKLQSDILSESFDTSPAPSINNDGLSAAIDSLDKAGASILEAATKILSAPELTVLRDT